MTQLLPLPGTFLGTFQQSASDGQNNIFVVGVAAGLGVDWAITRAVFLRAEWEFVGFAPVNRPVPTCSSDNSVSECGSSNYRHS